MYFAHKLLLPFLVFELVGAVKIGVSKALTTTVRPNTTTITTTIATTAAATTTITELPETASTVFMDDLDTTHTIASTTSNPNFTLFLFPPRKPTAASTKTTKFPTTTEMTLVDGNSTGLDNANAIPSTLIESLKQNVYCYCDLQLDACDVNCCCDRDCAPEALVVFDCNVVPKHPELQNRLEDFQYQHGLPSCKINDGWLCVFRTNAKPPREKPINLDMDTTHHYRWQSQIVAEQTAVDANVGHYKFGDPLKLLNLTTMETENFELPHAFRPPYCQIQEPIRYLKSLSETCLFASDAALQQHLRDLLQIARRSKLQLKPMKEPVDQQHIDDILGDIALAKCEAEKCVEVTPANSTETEMQLLQFQPTEIAVKIAHNYRQLLAARIELSAPAAAALPAHAERWLTFAVQFLYHNQSKPSNATLFATKLTSGPLGYLQGEPLIIATFMAYNQSEEPSKQNLVLSYFHPNASRALRNHTLPLFTRRQTLCHKSAIKRNYINYGISTLRQCNVRLAGEPHWLMEPQAANFTAICVRLQQLALEQLFDGQLADMQQLLVSELGKPHNSSARWTPLRLLNAEQPPVVGQYNAARRSFSCRNVLLGAAYEFRMGRFAERGIPHQALLKRATLTLAQRNDLEFALDDRVEVPLSVSVMFYDYAASDVMSGSARHCRPRLQLTAMLCGCLLLGVISI